MNKNTIFQNISYSYADSKRYTTSYNGPINKFIPEKGKKIAISWSGGKDSCYVLHKAKELGLDVKYLFNLTNKDSSMSLTWSYNLDFLEEQARQLGIKLIKVQSNGHPKKVFSDFFDFLISEGIEVVGAGYFVPEGQREFLNEIAYFKGISIFEPNHGKDQRQGLLDIINAGIIPKIVAMDRETMDLNYLGKNIDLEFYNYLSYIPEFKDFCGEDGSFQTITVNCKYFKNEIKLDNYYKFQIGHNTIHYYY